MTNRRTRAGAERGAILVQVGLALLAVLAFTAFVVDYGILWVSRGQSQNAADAAALAGAVALSYESMTDRTDTGPAKRSALNVALSHNVWGQPPTVTMADITFPPCPDDGTDSCIRVNVFRPGLPTFLARLAGVTSQDTKATATAKAGFGNAVECVKPFAVADKWNEIRPTPKTWATTDYYDKYDRFGNLLSGAVDVYVPPTATSFGTGFHPFERTGERSTDYGLPFTLKLGDPNDDSHLSAGWYMPLALPNDVGGNDYEWNIANCYRTPLLIGSTVETTRTEPGRMVGPTTHGVEALIAKDPGAYWNSVTKTVEGSAFAVSPRVVPIPLINVDVYFADAKAGRSTVQVVNILGFFVDRMSGHDVEGYLCAIPGNLVSTSPTVGNASSFLRTIQLVR
jgi:hypothetical protein